MQKARLEGLDIEQNLAHERLEWKLQRIGWSVCLMLIGAAALGVTGPGPMNRVRAEDGGLELCYGRVLHLGEPHEVELATTERTDTIWFDEDWFAAMKVELVWPVPERTTMERGRAFLTFRRSPSEPFVVRLRMRAQRSGVLRGEVGIDERALSFRQTVLP